MDNPLITSLSITVIGMTLLFLALILFYGLMSLMMSVMQERLAAESAAAPKEKRTGDAAMLQAAAIAVALARAEAERAEQPSGIPVQVGVAAQPAAGPWWTLHHQRRLLPVADMRRAR